MKEDEVKRRIMPLKGLGDAGNTKLSRGLQGSPLFESSRCIFQKFKSTIQSEDGEPRALPAPASQTRVSSVVLPRTSDTIRRFNRDTAWLATGVFSPNFSPF